MVLLDNGDVWVWGDNSGGRLALPEGQHPDLPIKHPTLKRIVNIGNQSAVDADGNLYTWGAKGYGDPSFPFQTIHRTPIKIAENIHHPVALVYGNNVSGVLTKDGRLYTWGWDKYGQLGLGQAVSKKPSHDEVLMVHKSLFTIH